MTHIHNNELRIVMENQEGKINGNRCPCPRKRLLLFPLPLQGHINPMLQLASILYTNGFSITILLHTSFPAPNTSNYPHFTFLTIPDDSDEMKARSSGAPLDLISRVGMMNECYGDVFCEFLASLLSDSGEEEEESIACLITDSLWHFTQPVADSLRFPRLVLRTSSLGCILVYETFSYLREQGYFNISKEDPRSEEPVPEVSIIKGKDVPRIVTKKPDALTQVIGNMIKQAKMSSGIIWNTFKELEEQELTKICLSFPAPNFVIGPFHKYFPASSSSLLAQDWSSISWLDSKAPKSVLYISFGSMTATLNETEFLEMAWGLANSKQPFLWAVRPGIVCGAEWIELLPKGFLDSLEGRGHIVKWAPQHEVLAHPATGGFWTHCGWNSTLEGICEGIPMICSPYFGDQPIDARYVTDVWKVGVYLENGAERADIERAIRRIMVEKEGEEMRERILHLKEKADLCIKKGGSSYESLENLVNYISSL